MYVCIVGKLIVCYDDNLITIDGDTALTFTEDVNQRYAAYHWHVETVSDANDLTELRAALDRARLETSRPSLIKVPVTVCMYAYICMYVCIFIQWSLRFQMGENQLYCELLLFACIHIYIHIVVQESYLRHTYIHIYIHPIRSARVLATVVRTKVRRRYTEPRWVRAT